jgi:hypothetical protein
VTMKVLIKGDEGSLAVSSKLPAGEEVSPA